MPRSPGATGGLTYSDPIAVYRAGRAIPPNLATISGGGFTFSVLPPLPVGLALDVATGAITGAPARTSPTTLHTVTATDASGSTSTGVQITVLTFPSALESAQSGQASSVRLLGAVYGQIVDVYDRDAAGSSRRIARDLVVHAGVATGGLYEVAQNSVTQGTRVTILAPLGTTAFANAYDALESNLTPLAASGPDALPPYSRVPRNATIALLFDDLVDPATVRPDTVRALTGVDRSGTQSARLRTDPNHGNVADRNGDGVLEFWSTRVLVVPVVSDAEASADPHLITPDPDGYPPALATNQSNLIVRVPTRLDAGSGQVEILRNLTGAAVSSTQSGPIDPSSPTLDVVRALRSGGPSASTGDPYEGFLPDPIAPRIVAEIPVDVIGVHRDPAGNPEDRLVDVRFADVACASRLQVGDSVAIGPTVVEVLAQSAPPSGALVPGVRVKLLRRTRSLLGSGVLHARHAGAGLQAIACALAFEPAAGSAPASLVDPTARVILRSDEPLDPASESATDPTRIARVAGGAGGREVVPTVATPEPDLRGFTLRPLVPLTHVAGASEAYHVRVGGWRDLAGNPLQLGIAEAEFTLDPAAPSVASGGVVFEFDSLDMLPGPGAPPDAGSGLPEFRGQFLIEPGASLVRGRPVSRFQASADRTQTVPSQMIPLAQGVQTPISRYGSKLQTTWRYCDLGFALLDEQFHNVDVEHLYWAPRGGVIADIVPRMEISLSTSGYLADEAVDANLLPRFPESGLVTTFAANVLDPVADPLRTVHPGPFGQPSYNIQPTNQIVTQTGTTVMPWRWNFGLPADRRTYYTWRNTGIDTRGAPNGNGVELAVNGGPTPPVPYAAGQVPTIGLPLLMEFRCYPNDAITGANAFDVSIAIASSSKPNFRAFSTGGLTPGGIVVRDPDLQTVAVGGFDPSSHPPGAATLPVDDVFYVGALDLVVRVSRMHSIWIDSGLAGAQWTTVIEPPASSNPAGTAIEVAYRGATAIANGALTTDAGSLDPYGDPRNGPPPTFHQADSTWKASVAALDGARFLQTRVTFVANAATNAVPVLSSYAIAWQ